MDVKKTGQSGIRRSKIMGLLDFLFRRSRQPHTAAENVTKTSQSELIPHSHQYKRKEKEISRLLKNS